MKIEYILIWNKSKKNKAVNNKPGIQNILKKCFVSVGRNSFELKYKKSNYVINYDCTTHITDIDNTVYYLTISYGVSNNEVVASVLDSVHTIFNSKINTGDSKFHVTISYDERALYFSSRAYPYFCKFESKLRCLILKLLTQIFGTLWAQKTLTENQISKLKEKTHSGNFEKIASEALYEMDFSTLESYLFAKTREVSPEYTIDNCLDNYLLKELSIEQIGAILEKARPRSNWERYFANKIVIEQLEEKLTIIREERNKVAHIKHYGKTDFDEDKQILSSFNLKLDAAIHTIEDSNLTAEEGLVAILIFELLIAGLSSVSSPIKQAFELSSELITSLSNSVATKTEIDMSALKELQAEMPKVDMSALKELQAEMPKVDMSALKELQAEIPKVDMSALKKLQAEMPKVDMTALKKLQASIPKIDMSSLKIAPVVNPKISVEELQKLRTSVIHKFS